MTGGAGLSLFLILGGHGLAAFLISRKKEREDPDGVYDGKGRDKQAASGGWFSNRGRNDRDDAGGRSTNRR